MSPHKYGKSYLTIGGYYDFDYSGDIYWYDLSSDSSEWNINVPSIKLGESEYYPDNSSNFMGKFQTGYPYIGLSDTTFKQVTSHIQ